MFIKAGNKVEKFPLIVMTVTNNEVSIFIDTIKVKSQENLLHELTRLLEYIISYYMSITRVDLIENYKMIFIIFLICRQIDQTYQ